MKPERWQQIEQLYDRALEMEESRRASFLREACAGDDDLRRELEQLLAEGRHAESFMEQPALREVAHEFAATAGSSWVGRQVGNYQFVSLVGAGGMGEVYQARDTKLKREVAIKILPDAFSNDPERVSRFQREAQLLASLNHPNIAAIYDLEEANEVRFLILELVEGETLEERLKRGPILLDEALQLASQIAEGLAAAHERGIIHRDLKPANIKLTPEGKAKVLDFGLAKAFVGDADASLLNSMSASTPGTILGTAAYMSPEQANGAVLDRRSDIFAFGAVLYEMLSGQRAFPGEILGDILAAVIRAEPDWGKLPAGTPSGIRRLLRRCLQKDRNRRLQSAGDAQIEIDEAQSEPQMDTHIVPIVPRRRERLAWTAFTVVTLIAAVAVVWVRHPVPSGPLPPEVRFEINTPPTVDPLSLAISPDGKTIVFVAVSEGRFPLWLHSLDSVSAGRPLAGTDGASFPFWSPDSRSIGFFADRKLKRIDTVSGSVETLASAYAGQSGAWNRDGTIIFNPAPPYKLLRVSSTGGKQVAQPLPDASPPGGQRFPQFLPDGNHFLYVAQGSAETRGVHIGQIDGVERRRLLDTSGSVGFPSYVPSGQILFLRDGTVFAQDFDPLRMALTGNPFVVAARQPAGSEIRVLSASAAGPIVYRTVSSLRYRRQLVWFDRSGRELAKVGGPGYTNDPELSPDERFVAMNENQDVSLLEIGRSLRIKFTVGPGSNAYPVWSPDGSRIAFSSNRKGVLDLYWKPTVGPAGSEELLLGNAKPKFLYDWSSDGRFLLYNQDGNLWALPLDGDRTPFPVFQWDYDGVYIEEGEFSPDVKWIAYQSNDSGQYEIYVQRFSGRDVKGTGRKQISTNGGTFVRWRRDGKELFYIGPDNRLMAVPIRLDPDKGAVEASAPIPLFATRLVSAQTEYMVSSDGLRFLMNTILEEPVSPITVILNWKAKP